MMPSKIVDQARAIVRQAEDDQTIVVDTTSPSFTITLPRPGPTAEQIRNLYLTALGKHLVSEQDKMAAERAAMRQAMQREKKRREVAHRDRLRRPREP
jgi:hypothetical protein